MTTQHVGETATHTPPLFNLRDMQHLMHGVAYQRRPIELCPREHYQQLANAVQTVEDAARLCQRTSAGLDMLLDLLANSDIERYITESMGGLLRPLAAELARTSTDLHNIVPK